jgi:hypothetical protein
MGFRPFLVGRALEPTSPDPTRKVMPPPKKDDGGQEREEVAASLLAHKKFPLGELELIPKAFVERLRSWHGRLNLQRESDLFQ